MEPSNLLGPALGAGAAGLAAYFGRKKRELDWSSLAGILGAGALGAGIGHVAQNAYQTGPLRDVDPAFQQVTAAPNDQRVYDFRGNLGESSLPLAARQEILAKPFGLFKTQDGYVQAPLDAVSRGSSSAEALRGVVRGYKDLDSFAAKGKNPDARAAGLDDQAVTDEQRAMFDVLVKGPEAASASRSRGLNKWFAPENRVAVRDAKQRLSAGSETDGDVALLASYENSVKAQQAVRSGFARRDGYTGLSSIGDSVDITEPGNSSMYARLLPFYGTGQDLRNNWFGDRWQQRAYQAQKDGIGERSGGLYQGAGFASGLAEWIGPGAAAKSLAATAEAPLLVSKLPAAAAWLRGSSSVPKVTEAFSNVARAATGWKAPAGFAAQVAKAEKLPFVAGFNHPGQVTSQIDLANMGKQFFTGGQHELPSGSAFRRLQ